MAQQVWYRFGVAILLAALPVVACSGTPQSPVSPGGTDSGALDANPDGSTLKAEAPALLSPINGITISNRTPVFQFQNAQGRYVGATFSYEIQVLDESQNAVYARTVAAGASTTAHTLDGLLVRDTPYAWRARAVLGGAHGPWSATAGFRTAMTLSWPACPQPMSSGGGSLDTPVRMDKVVEVAATSQQWTLCQAGAGPFHGALACHLFTREVALALHEEDPNWGLLTKVPGTWGCTATACGSDLTCHLAEDIIMHRASGRLVDIIIGAGAPGAQLAWQALPLGARRPTDHWTGPQ